MMHRRAAFSLLEVLLALAILLGSLVVLSELASTGGRHARRALDQTTAQRIAQTKMQEILAGLEAAEITLDQEVEGEPDWFYAIETEPLATPGLIAVRVIVTYMGGESGAVRPFTLVRWMNQGASANSTEPVEDTSSASSASSASETPTSEAPPAVPEAALDE